MQLETFPLLRMPMRGSSMGPSFRTVVLHFHFVRTDLMCGAQCMAPLLEKELLLNSHPSHKSYQRDVRL